MNANDLPMQPGIFFGQMFAVLVGLCLMMLGAAILYSIDQTRRHAQRLEGTLIGIRRRGAFFHSVYQYAAPGGGTREATSVQGGSSLKGRTTGGRVEICVLADHPDEAREATPATTWALILGLLASGGWLTYYNVTTWKRSIFTWIFMALIAAFVGRKLWRWLAPYLTKLRSQPAASYAWSSIPIENAETLGLAPQPPRFQMKGNSRRTGAIFCVVGLLVMASAYIPAHRLLLLRSGARTQGTVFQLYLNTANSSSIFPWVQYTGTDGAVVRFLDRTGSNPSAYKVGDTVTVLYQPGKNDTAMIDRGRGNWEVVVFTLPLGAVFTIMGVLSLRARSS